ncbi:UNVERIFIED_CONTAM: hypothetical protein HDU68_001262 [Siphonaria sp. JEL0065]|nr:hypothetical protein HDU68_001262 [Siphonaria sp. JEL0065]
MVLVLIINAIPFSSASDCFGYNFFQKLTFHLYVILFGGVFKYQHVCYLTDSLISDFLIVFKSIIATRKNTVFFVLGSLALMNRVGWGIADVALTGGGGEWDAETSTCTVSGDHSIAGPQHPIADIIIDVLSSIGAVAMFFKTGAYLLPAQSLFYHLVKENVFRSLIILVTNSVLAYINSLQTIPFDVMLMIWASGNIVVFYLMNLELYWKAVRSNTNNSTVRQPSRKEGEDGFQTESGTQKSSNPPPHNRISAVENGQIRASSSRQ